DLAAPGVRVEQVGRDDERLGTVGAPIDRAGAAAWTSFTEATVLTVEKQQTPAQPTSVTITGAGDGEPGAQHLLIVAEELSEATIVLNHAGSAQLAQTVEIDVRDGAQLTVVSLQEWDEGSIHLSAHRTRVGRDAKIRHIVVTLGGDIVRITPDSVLSAPGGEVEKIGLYFTDGDQHQEHRLLVDHSAPNCISRVTYELNRNLVLDEGARADSVLNLEIETGEIEGAGHASATGRFDDEQLFYLKARGIPEVEARRLVVIGFFAELINQIDVPSVTERLTAAIEDEIRQYEALTA